MKENIKDLCINIYGKQCPDICPIDKYQCDECSVCTDPVNLKHLLTQDELPQKWKEFIKNCTS